MPSLFTLAARAAGALNARPIEALCLPSNSDPNTLRVFDVPTQGVVILDHTSRVINHEERERALSTIDNDAARNLRSDSAKACLRGDELHFNKEHILKVCEIWASGDGPEGELRDLALDVLESCREDRFGHILDLAFFGRRSRAECLGQRLPQQSAEAPGIRRPIVAEMVEPAQHCDEAGFRQATRDELVPVTVGLTSQNLEDGVGMPSVEIYQGASNLIC